MRIGEAILRSGKLIGPILIAATLMMGSGVYRLRVQTRLSGLFPAHDPDVALTHRYLEFASRRVVYVMFQVRGGTIFQPKAISKLKNLLVALFRTPELYDSWLYSVTLWNPTNLKALPSGLVFRPFILPRSSTRAMTHQLQSAASSQRDDFPPVMLSANRHSAVLMSLAKSDADYGRLLDHLLQIATRNQDANDRIYFAGEPAVRGYLEHDRPVDFALLLAACALAALVCFMVVGSYRFWWVVLVTGCLSPALWGLGLAGFMNYPLDPMMLVVPIILSARTLSHALNWQRCYHATLDRLEDRHAACVATADRLFLPGLVAVAADLCAIGFISLWDIPLLQHVGLIGMLWLGSSLWLVYILQPIVISYLPVGRSRAWEWRGRVKRRVEDWTEELIELALTPGWGRAMLLASLLGLLVVGEATAALKIPIGYPAQGTPLYPSNARVNTDTAAIARRFPLDLSWIVINTPPPPDSQSVLTTKFLRLTDRLQDYLMMDPGVSQAFSFVTRTKELNQKFNYAFPKFYGIPESAGLLGGLWMNLRMADVSEDFDRFFGGARGANASISILTRDRSPRTLTRLKRELTRFQQRYLAHDPTLSRVHLHYLGGPGGLYAAADEMILPNAVLSLTLVLAGVACVAAIAFTSVTGGCMVLGYSVLANLLAFIMMSATGLALSIETVLIISLAVGVGASFAIVVMTAIRTQVAAGWALDDAIRVALAEVSSDVLCIAALLFAGLIPWLFSPTAFNLHMAALFLALLGVNAIAALLLLPAFLSWGRFEFIMRHATAG
ncbi:MAG TPA: hypothetical protein VKV28_10700 [Candidatus Binataceae bacterium]|nr:hypothetical protein [Candidatus Binataceae bacterium]